MSHHTLRLVLVAIDLLAIRRPWTGEERLLARVILVSLTRRGVEV